MSRPDICDFRLCRRSRVKLVLTVKRTQDSALRSQFWYRQFREIIPRSHSTTSRNSSKHYDFVHVPIFNRALSSRLGLHDCVIPNTFRRSKSPLLNKALLFYLTDVSVNSSHCVHLRLRRFRLTNIQSSQSITSVHV